MREEPSLDVEALLRSLSRHGVAHILTGSVAALAYGVALQPGDLDIAPDLDPENMTRLGGLLRDLGAKPKHLPAWTRGPSLEECARWTPEPADEKNLDHRFVTPLGELDVVPRLAGSYEELAPRAVSATAFGLSLRLAHPDALIALCRKWNRETDRLRLPALEAARSDFREEAMPVEIGDALRRR